MKVLELISFIVFVAFLFFYIPARLIFGAMEECFRRLNQLIEVN